MDDQRKYAILFPATILARMVKKLVSVTALSNNSLLSAHR